MGSSFSKELTAEVDSFQCVLALQMLARVLCVL